MLFFMDLPEMKFALKIIGDRAGDQKRSLSLCRSVGVGIANVGKAQSLTKSLLFLLSSYVKETKQNNKQTNRSFLPLKKGWENIQSPDLWKFLTTTEEGKIIIKSPALRLRDIVPTYMAKIKQEMSPPYHSPHTLLASTEFHLNVSYHWGWGKSLERDSL